MDSLKWGEEMEYVVYQTVKCPKTNTTCLKLTDKGPELIAQYNENVASAEDDIVLMPEFGSWMVEAVPAQPYQSLVDPSELLSCEEKIHKRRHILDSFFREKGFLIASMTNVPSLGTPGHGMCCPEVNNKVKDLLEKEQDMSSLNPASESSFVLDSMINPHPRFAGLVKSIREHRGEKVDIRVPLFKDKYTNMTEATKDEPYPGEIYMDAMAFGMG